MKKLILAMMLILTLTFVFVGCNKDKDVSEPTTEKTSTTEPTAKFEVPEIKDEPTTEETTEATTESTTKKPVYSSNSGSSSGSGSSSKPASTTKASSSNNINGEVLPNGDIKIPSAGGGTGGLIIPEDFGKTNEGSYNGDGNNIGSADDFVQDGIGTGADSIE